MPSIHLSLKPSDLLKDGKPNTEVAIPAVAFKRTEHGELYIYKPDGLAGSDGVDGIVAKLIRGGIPPDWIWPISIRVGSILSISVRTLL